MILDELLVGLGFDYDPEEMSDFKDDISKTVGLIGALVKVATAGAAAITSIVVASTKASDEQGKLADEIGETVENISALQFAQKIAGGTTEEMTSSLRDLSIRAAEAARGVGSGVEAFGILGISATDLSGRVKPTSQLMLEISQRFQGLGKARQIELADKLGLRGSIRLLQQGPKAIRELTEEAKALGVTTSEDAAIAAEFQDSLVKLWTITKQFSRTLTRVFAPILNSIAEGLTEWWKANKQLIESKIPEWIDKLTLALKLASLALASFLAFQLLSNFSLLIGFIMRGVKAMLLFNASALLIPTLIGAAVLALIALMEDAHVFFEGGDSFIGEMIEKFPKWASQLRTVASVFGTLAKLTTMIIDGWDRIFDLFSSTTLEDIKGFFKNIPGFLGDITGINTVDDRLARDLQSVNSTSNSQRIDKVEINVTGNADPQLTAEAVRNEFQQTAQDLNSAVDQ